VLAASNIKAMIAYFIALMMEAASTSETLVNVYQTTRRYIPEVVFILAAVRN
jgi:ABC-type arginine transport system permease subunit